MDNQNPQEESLKGKPNKKVANKKNKQANVLKQLNNQKLYPIQERIGIYVIAILSTIGLVLIVYTGMMALVSRVTIPTEVSADVNVDELSEMLENLSDITDLDDEIEESSQGTSANDNTNPEEESISSEDGVITGIINTSDAPFLREAGVTTDTIVNLHSGDVVTIIDIDSNPYWTYVEATTIYGTVQGYVERSYIDVD